MKHKILAFVLTAMMTFSLVACSNDKQNNQEAPNTENTQGNIGDKEETKVDINDALELLDAVWANYKEDEKFAAMGGDRSEENLKEDAPGVYSLDDAEAVDSELGFPAASIDTIDQAASLIHMMNANTFTCGAYHIKDKDSMESVAASLKENILNRRWMCGFPEKLVIYSVGDYLISVFGDGELITTFEGHLTEAYPSVQTVSEDAIE